MYYLSYERCSRACMLINKYDSFLAFFHICIMPNQWNYRRKSCARHETGIKSWKEQLESEPMK